MLEMMQKVGPYIIPNEEVFKNEVKFLASHSTKIAAIMSRTSNSLNFAAGLIERFL